MARCTRRRSPAIFDVVISSVGAIERGEGQGITHGTRSPPPSTPPSSSSSQPPRPPRPVASNKLSIPSLPPPTPSVFPSSSLLFFPPPLHLLLLLSDSPLLRLFFVHVLQLPRSLRLSPPPPLFYPTSSSSSSPGFLPCVSLSLRTHLPAERGRTCSTVALRHPKYYYNTLLLALHRCPSENFSRSRESRSRV